jgi:hypothetical protein
MAVEEVKIMAPGGNAGGSPGPQKVYFKDQQQDSEEDLEGIDKHPPEAWDNSLLTQDDADTSPDTREARWAEYEVEKLEDYIRRAC